MTEQELVKMLRGLRDPYPVERKSLLVGLVFDALPTLLTLADQALAAKRLVECEWMDDVPLARLYTLSQALGQPWEGPVDWEAWQAHLEAEKAVLAAAAAYGAAHRAALVVYDSDGAAWGDRFADAMQACAAAEGTPRLLLCKRRTCGTLLARVIGVTLVCLDGTRIGPVARGMVISRRCVRCGCNNVFWV